MRRRDLLHFALLLCTSPSATLANHARNEPVRGPAHPFDYAALKGRARALAAREYSAPATLAPESLRQLSYDQYQSIRFRRDEALWAHDERAFRVEFFHQGRGFKEPVRMYEVVSGTAREIRYRPSLFDFERTGMDTHALGDRGGELAFAGFRVHSWLNWDKDVAAFLGASYFRAVSTDSPQFGLSARGLALDTGLDIEEFPRFIAFWFERPAADVRTLVLYGLLDSVSVAGAYRFVLTPGAAHIMEVDAAVYPRKTIRRLGIAPLTSMFHYGENDRRLAYDWRPEVHDSDGLAIWTGQGEWIWRPLTNPATLRVNSFLDDNPRGFGLLQRDRNFEHYQDDGVFYEARPSLWIEPKAGPGGGWGKGCVQLVELTAHDETFDNVVAYWTPSETPQPGQELLYSYRMYWTTKPPPTPPLAQVVATRTGLGGVVGRKRQYFSWRFAIDFAGGELAALAERAEVEPVISISRGSVEIPSARPLESIDGYRAMFDVKPPDDSLEPIDLRVFLRHRRQPLTETWIYQWNPPSARDRRLTLNAAAGE